MRAFSTPLLLLTLLAGCESKGTAPSPPTSRPSEPRSVSAPAHVEVTSAGFQPASVDVNANRTLVFRRTADQTCATAVVFPSLGIQKPLPLNTDVVIELPPAAKGELTFQCGMSMYRGKVVVH